MLRHYDQDERQTDGSRHWDRIRPALFAVAQGARDFDEGFWFTWFMKAATGKYSNICKDNHGSLCYWRAIQGHSGGIPRSSELMDYTLILYTDTLTCGCAQHTFLHEHITAHSVAQDEGASHVKSPRILIVIHLVLSVLNIPFVPFPALHSSSSASLSRSTTTAPSYTRSRCTTTRRYQGRGWPIGRLLPRAYSVHPFTQELRGFFNPFCEWNYTGRKRGWQGSTSSLVYNLESIRKRPGRRRTSFWLHCSSNGTLSNVLETQSRCGLLDHSNQERRMKDCRTRLPATIRGSCAQTISPWSLPVLNMCRTRKQAAKLQQPSVFQCSVLTSTRKLDAVIMLESWLAPG